MRSALFPQRFSAFDDLSSADVQALLAGARSPVPAAGVAATLRNRHVVVLCEAAACEPAAALDAAATALGATVVRLRPSTLRLDERLQLRGTARLLGRLYHLIGCEGLGPAVSAGLARWAGVPVLSNVLASSHPASVLADLLAMQEHAHRPAAEITLGLVAQADTTVAQAWRQASALTGVQIVRLRQLPAAGFPAACDFVLSPQRQRQRSAGQLPQLMAAASTAGGVACLAEQQRDAHRRLLLSLLTHLTA